MDFDAANKSRDRRLRRGILVSLHHARGFVRGGLSGQTLMDLVTPAGDGQGFEDAEHCIRLIRDLELKGMIDRKIEGLRRNQRLQPSHLFVSITDKGSRLINETEPIDPDIDDERVEVKS